MPNERERRFNRNIEFTDDGRLVIMDANLALKIAEYFSKNGNLMVEIMSWGELGVSYKERGEGVSLGYTFSALAQTTGNPDPVKIKNLGCDCDISANLRCSP